MATEDIDVHERKSVQKSLQTKLQVNLSKLKHSNR